MNMYCPKCGNEISDKALFCSTCGNKIETEDEYDRLRREVLENEPKPLYKSKIYWFILLGLVGIFIYITNNDSNNSQKNENKQSCIGNENCIDKVRFYFTNSGKQILNESYNGNGVFTITGLDPSKGVTFNSTVTTDCNCQLIDVKISDIN